MIRAALSAHPGDLWDRVISCPRSSFVEQVELAPLWFGEFPPDASRLSSERMLGGGGTAITLEMNDMSIEWGGVLDICGDWNLSKRRSFHRVGPSIDVENAGLRVVDPKNRNPDASKKVDSCETNGEIHTVAPEAP